MVIWSDWLTSIASAFDTSVTEAGIIFSLAFTIMLIIVVLIATRGKKPGITMSITSLFVTVFFTFLGWYPIWVGSVLALVLSIMTARTISEGI